MATFYKTGTQRILYKSVGFATGLTVTCYMWDTSLSKSALQTLTEVSDGFYYLDWDFSSAGVWFAKFYEGGIATISGVFRVDTEVAAIKAVTDILFGHSTTISSVVTPDTVFDIADGIPNADGYNNMVIAIKDVSSGYWITKKVTDYDTTGHFRITIDSDAEFPLAENDIVKFSNLSYSPTVAGGSLTVDEILDGLTTGHDIPNSVGRKIGRLREAF